MHNIYPGTLIRRSIQVTKCRKLGVYFPKKQHQRRFTTPNSRPQPVSGSAGRTQNADTDIGMGFFSWYSKKLDESPMTTKIVSSALIAAAGDVICQVLENNLAADENDEQIDGDITFSKRNIITESSHESVSERRNEDEITEENRDGLIAKQSIIPSINIGVDCYRTARFLLIGAFWVAPATHLWYGFLSTRLVPGSATPKRVVQRLFLDQFGAAPVFAPTFMGLLWLLEGKSPSEVKSDIIKAGPTLVTSNWKLWIPAMGLMFSIVPLKFQVVYSNFVGLVWTVYLSWASTRLSSQRPRR